MDYSKEYEIKAPTIGKPDGFWLSDDSDFGWKEWCKGSRFRAKAVKHKIRFRCDTENWLVISSAEDFIRFEKRYLKLDPRYKKAKLLEPYALQFHGSIDFRAVKKKYGGLLITPYRNDFRLRLDCGNIWYYGWDCASGCVWDLASIRRLSKHN